MASYATGYDVFPAQADFMTDVVVAISHLVPRQSRLWCSLLAPLVPDFFATLAPSALFVSPLYTYTLYCTAAADVVAAIRR